MTQGNNLARFHLKCYKKLKFPLTAGRLPVFVYTIEVSGMYFPLYFLTGF